MIDLMKLKDNFDEIASRMFKRGVDSKQLSEIIQQDEQRKELIGLINNLRNTRNKLSSEKVRENREVTNLRVKIKAAERKLENINISLRKLYLQLPNIPAPNTPSNQEGNLVKREFWSKQVINNSLPHEKVIAKLAITDERNAAKMATGRFVIYKDLGVQLLHSLITFMLSENQKKGYRLVSTPYLVNKNTLYNTGQLPKFSDDLFKLENSDLTLIPTSEVTLVNLYADQLINFQQLPIKLCSYSPCFRAEAGSAGQENKGIIRLHQFNKVELVKITEPETSYAELESLVADAADLLEQLGISYRIIDLCYKELGVSAAKTYDIEAWLPVSKKWLEISSCSNCEDFQANRASIRSKIAGKRKVLHTLNGSALAIDRLILILTEYYFDEQTNKLEIPACLRDYLRDCNYKA